jgi:hypothetical protein
MLDAHQPEREDQRLASERVDERGGDRGRGEQGPAASHPKPRAGRRRQNRLEGEGRDQREAEDEAAVQVRP